MEPNFSRLTLNIFWLNTLYKYYYFYSKFIKEIVLSVVFCTIFVVAVKNWN